MWSTMGHFAITLIAMLVMSSEAVPPLKKTFSEIATIAESYPDIISHEANWAIHIPIWVPCDISFYSPSIQQELEDIANGIAMLRLNQQIDFDQLKNKTGMLPEVQDHWRKIFQNQQSSFSLLSNLVSETEKNIQSAASLAKDIQALIGDDFCESRREYHLVSNLHPVAKVKRSTHYNYHYANSNPTYNIYDKNSPSSDFGKQNGKRQYNSESVDLDSSAPKQPEILHHDPIDHDDQQQKTDTAKGGSSHVPRFQYQGDDFHSYNEQRSDGTIKSATLVDPFYDHIKRVKKVHPTRTNIYICDSTELPNHDTCSYIPFDPIITSKKSVKCITAPCFDDNDNINTKRGSFRQKRGLFNFVGDFYKTMFGVATEEQLKVIQQTINATIEKEKVNQDMIIKLGESIQMMATQVDSKIQQVVSSTNAALTNLSQTTLQLYNGISTIEKNLGNTNITLLFMARIELYESHISRKSVLLQYYKSRIDTLLLVLTDLYHSIIMKSLPSTILSKVDIDKMLDGIAHKLPNSLHIPSNIKAGAILDNTNVKITTSDGRIFFTVNLPLTSSTIPDEVWRIVPIPFYKGSKWVKLQIPEDFITYNAKKNTWTWIDHATYTTCIASPMNFCRLTYPWMIFTSLTCIGSALFSNNFDMSTCSVVVSPSADMMTIHALQLSTCKWLISKKDDKDILTSECLTSEGTIVKKSSTISRVSVITVGVGCTSYIGNLTLQCIPSTDQILRGSTYFEEISILPSDGGNLIPFTYDPLDDQLPEITIHTPAQPAPMVIGNQSFTITNKIKLSDIGRSINRSTSNFITESDAIDAKLELLQSASNTNSVSLWDSLSFGFYNSLTWLSFIMSSASLIFCCYIWFTSRSTIMTAATLSPPLLMDRLPGSFAASIRLDTPIILNTTNNTEYNSTILQVIMNHASSVPDGFIHLVVVHLFAILIMIICHRLETRRLLQCVWVPPKNKKSLHHPGEVQLMGRFLLKVSTLFSRKKIYREVVIQIATLPRSFDEWYCETESNISEFLTGISCSRLKYNLYAELKWGCVCIKSTFEPNLETCEDMPSKLKININELMPQLSLPWYSLWTSIRISNINGLFLSGPSFYKELLSYNNSNSYK